MTLTSKLGLGASIGAVVLVIIGALLFIIKEQRDLITKQQAMQESMIEMKQLQDNWVRSSSQFVSKDDLNAFLKDNSSSLDALKKDIDALGASITGGSVITSNTPGYNGSDLPSTTTKPGTNTSPGTNTDPYGYQKNTQVLALNEPFADGVSVPWGEVGFSAWKEKPWNLNIKPRKYSVLTVVSTTEDGQHLVHNQFSIEVDGKRQTIPVQSSEFKEVYPESKFSFNPHLMLGADMGVYTNPPLRGEVEPSLQVSLFSYGQTKVNPTWTFLDVGVGYASQAQRPNAIITPFTYNVGKHIPLMSNLHVGPSVSVDTSGNIGVMGGVKVGL